MRKTLSILLTCMALGTQGQEVQIQHIAPALIQSNGVSKIVRLKIIAEENALQDTTEIYSFEFDEQFRIVKMTVLKALENSKYEVLYQYDSVGVTNVKELEQGIQVNTQNYDPSSSTDCFCPTALDSGADREYYPNGLLKREDYRQWINEYLYEFENKN
ncbi:MAG: hypothetical protein ACJAUD_002316 [Crocinitomicaceae bacterium]|jgi:hypothetical protein